MELRVGSNWIVTKIAFVRFLGGVHRMLGFARLLGDCYRLSSENAARINFHVGFYKSIRQYGVFVFTFFVHDRLDSPSPLT